MNVIEMDVKKIIKEIEYQIHSAEQMYSQLPEQLLSKFTEAMMAEHEGYIKGLKVALNIIDTVGRGSEKSI